MMNVVPVEDKNGMGPLRGLNIHLLQHTRIRGSFGNPWYFVFATEELRLRGRTGI